MNKDDVLAILSELYVDVCDMREEGETDLRSVLSLIDDATDEINDL